MKISKKLFFSLALISALQISPVSYALYDEVLPVGGQDYVPQRSYVQPDSPTPTYRMLTGINQTVSTTATFTCDIPYNLAGIWINGVSMDVNTIAVVKDGGRSITLKSSLIKSLPQGENLISIVAKDGGMASAIFYKK